MKRVGINVIRFIQGQWFDFKICGLRCLSSSSNSSSSPARLTNSRMFSHRPITFIPRLNVDEYEEKVARTYDQDSPEIWKKVLGENLLFQFGIFDEPIPSGQNAVEISGIRYFERQLQLAGLAEKKRPQIQRILDLGCGWGYVLRNLATRFPDCSRLDGVNISIRQLEYCVEYFKKHGVSDRSNLYNCNAGDIDELPDKGSPYDLVIIRGAITHFSKNTFETVLGCLYDRMATGGTIIISESLYNVEPDSYVSAIPDDSDRLACKHRKTYQYFINAITQHGFILQDARVLPSNTDVIRWLMVCKDNIEVYYSTGGGVNNNSGALEELRVVAENWSIALTKNEVSVYSFILRKS